MSKERNELKFKLLQIREDAAVRMEEVKSFCRYADIQKRQLDVHNVFDHPHFKVNILDGFDGLFIGGASEASVLEPENYPFLDDCFQLVRDCIELEIPVFASCFGFQLTILALGGEIVRSKDNFEMGTLPISLEKEAEKDPIYKGIRNPFYAVSVHQESAHSLPANCHSLAYTDFCMHGIKVDAKPFWAFQFHPELDRSTLTSRLGVYKEKYTRNGGHFQEIINGLVDTPEANKLVRNFVEYVRDLG